MSQDLNITETAANTEALHSNTEAVYIASVITIVVMVIGFWGYNKYKNKNIVKKTINKFGTIFQKGKNNVVDDVDNTNGEIHQD